MLTSINRTIDFLCHIDNSLMIIESVLVAEQNAQPNDNAQLYYV